MPRGDKDGSIIHVPAVRDGRRIIKPEHWKVRRHYTLKGQAKEKGPRIAYSITEARNVKRAIDAEIESELAGANKPVPTAHTFTDLVTLAKQRQVKPAEYIDETKVGGMRSWKKTTSNLQPVEDYFGRMLVTDITYDDLAKFKTLRLNTPTIHQKARSIASVDRELALLRMLLFIAVREGWISINPFHRGRSLIQTADEVERMRILSFAEEERLLAVCTGRRAHLRRHIIFAIETGLRRNEQLTLKLSDIDFDDRLITVRAFNAKTAKPRVVPIFDRLARELELLRLDAGSEWHRLQSVGSGSDGLLFTDGCPRKAFDSACVAAKIEGLRWHDLRHTAATRLLYVYGLQQAEAMKVLGHTNPKTFLRYVNIDREVARSIRERVDAARGALAPLNQFEEAERISNAVYAHTTDEPVERPLLTFEDAPVTEQQPVDLGDVNDLSH